MTQNNPGNHSIFMGLLLIMAGIIVFLINLGYGSWEIIWQIWRLWPLIIIFIGIRIIWQGPSSQWFTYGFWLLVALGIIVLLLMNPKLDTGPAESGNYTHASVSRSDYPKVTAGKAVISFGGGKIAINSKTGEWLEGNFGGFNAQTSVKNLQNTLEINLKQNSHLPRSRWRYHDTEWNDTHQPDHGFRWDIQLSPELPWDIELRTGGIKGDADLSGIPLKHLRLKMGAGDFSLNLGNQSSVIKVVIESGASHIKVRVPKDSGVRVKLSGALVNTNIKNLGWILSNQTYTSPDYEKAANHVDIDLNMAVGDLELEK
jgi:hypothetical protein